MLEECVHLVRPEVEAVRPYLSGNAVWWKEAPLRSAKAALTVRWTRVVALLIVS